MLEEIYCHDCGEELENTDDIFYIGGGEYICENCRYDYYIACDDCGNLVYEGDAVPVEIDTRIICEDCANDYYTCDHCNDLYSSYNLAVNSWNTTLCESCFEEYYFICEGCDEVYHIDDGDGYYCYECAEDRRNYILSYSHKPVPVFFGGEAGYGLEVEIDDGDDKQDAARAINKAGEDHIYIKEDGSLSADGFEIVTHPATLKYHMEEFPWNEILSTATEYEYKSHDTNTCGLHIHASRELFGHDRTLQDLNIAKSMLLIDAYWDEYIVPFSRRDYDRLERWANKPNAGITTNDYDFVAIDKVKKVARKGRYQAVNLNNYHTVEFRFFRGTLLLDTILASIQFVHVLIEYVKNTQLKDIFNHSFREIFANTEYTELTEYLKKINIIKEAK